MTASEKDVVGAFEMIAARHTPPKDATVYPYRLVPFDELRPGPQSPYLIRGMIPWPGLVTVWGPPKCGKSFWTFDLVLHIALGWPYRGRRVRQGSAAYFAFEGAEGFRARAEAFRRTHQITGKVPFYLIATNAKLVRDHKALITSIIGQTDDIPPIVVVLDTLNRSIDGSENKDEDMGAYLAAAETICQEFYCTVIVVHHCGVDGSRPRGHSSLTGNVVAQLAVKRNAANHVIVEIEAMKDGAEGARFASALKTVEVGTDEDGDPITSCAIEPVEGAPPQAGAGKGAGNRMNANQARFMDILRGAIDDAPAEHKTTVDIPGDQSAISREWLKMCCVAKGWLDDDGANKARAKFSEMINTLAGKRLIGTTKLFVWIV